jgi:hypothetical protein
VGGNLDECFTGAAIDIEILQNHLTWRAFQLLVVRTFWSDLLV